MALSYREQLLDHRWELKKNEILNRDNNTCLICGDKNHFHEVHHICYIPDLLAWEYDNELLKTVCRKHHIILTYDLPKISGLIAWDILAGNISII
jgi:5-methylcytosine-specific restriction endonuclease McrA